MILRVNTVEDVLLNIRHGAPSTSAAVAGHLKANETRKIVDIKEGDELEGNKVWYQHEDNTYTWSGGYHPPAAATSSQTYLEKKAAFLADKSMTKYHNGEPNEDKWKVSWAHVDMGICQIWEEFKTQGEGVRVAIIDSGVHDKDNDLKGRIKTTQSFTNVSSTEDIAPYHGTMTAGLIGANGNNCKTVYGVAPACEMHVYRAITKGLLDDWVYAALYKAIKDGAKIICMSLELNEDVPDIKKLISECIKNNIIVIASAGNTPTGQYSYPASYLGCLSIGGYSLNDQKNRIINNYNYNNALTFLGPSSELLTTSISDVAAKYKDTSAACAFMTGVFALIASKYDKLNYKTIIDLLSKAGLNTVTQSIEKNTLRSDKEGFGVVRINEMINQLIQLNT